MNSLEVAISGAESTTLGLSNFSTDDSSPIFTYTADFDADEYGTYNITFVQAESWDGQTDGETMEDSVTIEEPFHISNLTLENRSGVLTTSFDSTKELDGIDLAVDGPDSRSFSLSNLSESIESGDYTYSGNYTPDDDGNYTALLSSASSTDGDSTTPDLTANATVDVRFNITDLRANTTANRELGLMFNATEMLDSVMVNVSGAESTTLGLSNFSTDDLNAPYTYSGVYNRTVEGVYNVTLVRGESADGQVDEPALEASERINESLEIWNLTLSDDDGTLVTKFQTTERLQDVDAYVEGPDSRSFSVGDFSESSSSGNHTYTANYTPDSDGEYTASVTFGRSTDGNTAEPNLTANATVEERFNVTQIRAVGKQDGPITVNFTATDPVDTVAIKISGPENATLGMDEFSTTDTDGPYVYNGSHNASTPGEYTVTFQEAESTAGLTDDERITANATIDEQLRVWNLTLSNRTHDGNLTVDFQSTESLTGVDLNIGGPVPHELSLSNFTETSANGNYTYTSAFGTVDGSYNGTLTSATSDDESVTPDLTDNTTINARFNVTNLTATGSQGGPLAVNFTATDPVETVVIDIAGPENATLNITSFTTDDSSDPYVYNGSYNASTPGEYTVTLQNAESTAGLIDDDSLIANATIDEPLRVWNFTLSNGAEKRNLSVGFQATEPLSAADIAIEGPTTYNLPLSNFTETSANETYTYTTEFSTADGTYKGILNSATSEADSEESVTPDLTDNTTINARFNVTNLTADGRQGGLLLVNFTATDPVDSVDIGVSGPENTTLHIDSFSSSDSSDPYVYNGSYNTSTPGEYEIRFQEAESTTGLVDDDSLTANATIDEPLQVWNFTLSNGTGDGNLTTSFHSNEPLSGADVNINGSREYDLPWSNFTETGTNGNYTYTTEFTTADGIYNGTLVSATGDDGEVVEPDLTDNTTIDARFDIYGLNATKNANRQNISISFNATDRLDKLAVNLSGAANTTLTLAAFSTNSTASPYQYTGTYDASNHGTYDVIFDRGQSHDGQVDDDDMVDTVTFEGPLEVWNLTLTDQNGSLTTSFVASKQLTGIDATVDGPDRRTYSYGDFNESTSEGNYTYTTTSTSNSDGNYTATLSSVTGVEGQSLNPDLSDNATVNERFNVTNLTASAAQTGPLTVNFTATDPVDTTTINITGPDDTTLGIDAFSTSDTDDPYVYTGSYNTSVPGEYTVTFQEAESTTGLVDDDSLTANATIDEPLQVWNFTLSNGTDPRNLSVGFQATEPLSGADIDIEGPTPHELSLSNFTETSANRNYTYTTAFGTVDGSYNGTLISATSDDESVSPTLTDNTTINARFNITNLTATGSQGGPLAVNFTASDPVDTVSIAINGPENTTLGRSAFSTIDSDSPYVYNGTYNASTPGKYTVTFQEAKSTAGLIDDDPLSANASLDRQLRVWNFSLVNNDGTLETTFAASKSLSEINARIDGPNSRILDRGNFSKTGANGNYTYTARHTPDADGNYTATLSSVTDDSGTERTPDLTANAAIDERFDVRNLSATVPSPRTIAITFNATDRLRTATIEVTGPEATTLDLDTFSTNDSSSLFTYTGEYNVSAAGNYTITFVEGTSGDGKDDSENLTDSVRIDDRLNVTDLRMTNVSGNLSIEFNASEPLASAPVEIRGPVNQTLNIGEFSETVTNGVYLYETEYTPSADGDYMAQLTVAEDDDGDRWSNILTANETVDSPAPGVNVTLRDLTDRDGIVNETDRIRVIANISSATNDADFDRIPFANGTTSLIQVDDDTYATNATVGNLTSGEYTVQVRAFGTNGHEASSESNSIMVDTDPPIANISVHEETVTRGTTVRLAALTTTDGETQIVDTKWQVNDETIAENTSILESQETAPTRLYSGTATLDKGLATASTDVQNVTYTFEDTGTHSVSLTLVDAAGNTNTDTDTVTVTEQSSQQPTNTQDEPATTSLQPSTTTTTPSSTTPPTSSTTPPTTTSSSSNTATTSPDTPTQTTSTDERTVVTPTTDGTADEQSPSRSGGVSTTAPPIAEGGVGSDGSKITVSVDWAFLFLSTTFGFLGLYLYYFREVSLDSISLPYPLLFWKQREEDESDIDSDD